MSVFYKIAENGKEVHVVKSLFAKQMSEEDFKKKAKSISVEDFLVALPKSISETLGKEIDFIRKTAENVFTISADYTLTPLRDSVGCYSVNGIEFTYSEADYRTRVGSTPHDETEEAREYVKKLYGEEFLESIKDTLLRKNVRGEKYFVKTETNGIKEISEEKYKETKARVLESTKITKADVSLKISNNR